MNKEEFMGKLQMCYFGERNAFEEIVSIYEELIKENEKLNHYKLLYQKVKERADELEADMKFVLEQVLGAFTQNWCIDWNFTDIREKHSISDKYEWNKGCNEVSNEDNR